MSWHKTVYDEITLPIFRLVNAMMNPDVTRRIKIEEAHERYNAILPAVNGLFTNEQISKYLKGYVKFRSEPNPPWISNAPAPVPVAAPVAANYVGINVKNRMEINGNTSDAFTNALSSAESSVGPLVAPSNRKMIIPAGPVRKPPPIVADFSGRPPPMNVLNSKIAALIKQKGTRSLASMPLAEIMPAKTRKTRKNRKHRKE